MTFFERVAQIREMQIQLLVDYPLIWIIPAAVAVAIMIRANWGLRK